MPEELKQTLDELHDQLQRVEQIDDEERQRLQKAVQEIQASLDNAEISSASLAKMFHDSTDQFSQKHPWLTRTAGQVADMLSQMGI